MSVITKRPRGRPPVPCERISPSSKRCRDREEHPYPPYRCACTTKPKKATVVKNPLFVAPRRQPPGRPRLINWSRDGLPNQFVKVFKDAGRSREKQYVRMAANSKKYQLMELTRGVSGLLSSTEQAKLDRLLTSNPTTIGALDRFTKKVEAMDAYLSIKRNRQLKSRPRKDPSANTSLGAYWIPSSKRQRRAPTRFT